MVSVKSLKWSRTTNLRWLQGRRPSLKLKRRKIRIKVNLKNAKKSRTETSPGQVTPPRTFIRQGSRTLSFATNSRNKNSASTRCKTTVKRKMLLQTSSRNGSYQIRGKSRSFRSSLTLQTMRTDSSRRTFMSFKGTIIKLFSSGISHRSKLPSMNKSQILCLDAIEYNTLLKTNRVIKRCQIIVWQATIKM